MWYIIVMLRDIFSFVCDKGIVGVWNVGVGKGLRFDINYY